MAKELLHKANMKDEADNQKVKECQSTKFSIRRIIITPIVFPLSRSVSKN